MSFLFLDTFEEEASVLVTEKVPFGPDLSPPFVPHQFPLENFAGLDPFLLYILGTILYMPKL